ncbi:uncharacterized protein LOC17874479 [Capsella rubella]|uniref:uncharacterized protein LOC17874479 n=1 Tax=Capsella rubella TaxID=81985 RepID=UPI000CD58CC0|nr:uncharacterized protein LOC17874479 [Capsella rubella]
MYNLIFSVIPSSHLHLFRIGVGGLDVASCLDMISSKTLEVPLRESSIAYRSSTLTLEAEDIMAKTTSLRKNTLLLAWKEYILVLHLSLDSQLFTKPWKSLEVTVEPGRILLVLSFLHLRFISLFFVLIYCTAYVFAASSAFSDVYFVAGLMLSFSCNGG